MLSREDNELLCRVGPDTPMGRMMRRYWLPAAISSELMPGTPKRVRLLGEDFVAFRGDDDIVGMLDELCPHRGASLVLGRSDGCALRCMYHGWLVDRDGAVLEMPAEPEGTAFTAKVRHPAYPVHESAGIVWTYIGPPALRPPVPHFAFDDVPESHRMTTKHRTDCNWTQSFEGAIDTAHSNYLHADDIKPVDALTAADTTQNRTTRPSRDGRPRIQTEDMPYGFRYAALRKPLESPDVNQYVRITHFVAPFTAVIPLGELQNVQIFVPIDDTHNYQYNVKFGPAPMPESRRKQFAPEQNEIDFKPDRHRDNKWRQNRDAMKKGSYTGIDVVRNQDTAVQESMGPIFDRSKEHLGTSDAAIIRMRKRMLDAVKAFREDGAEPIALKAAYDDVLAVEGMLRLDQPWQLLLAEKEPA
jgi:phthalate 4,5-dioxygenase oxygenase subunit